MAGWRILLLAGLTACTTWLPPRLSDAHEAHIRRCRAGLLMVAVEVGDQAHSFIIDTGASITAITPQTAALASIAASGTQRVNGSVDMVGKRAKVSRLAVAGAIHRDVQVAVLEVTVAEALPLAYDGILGLDVLSRHDAIIDLSRGVLALLPPGDAAREPRVQQRLVRLPIKLIRNGLIRVDVDVGGKVIPAVLDLGATSTIVNPATSTAKRISGRVRIGGVDLGEQSLVVRHHPMFARWGLGDRPAMLLAGDLLLGRAFVLAYGERAIYLSREAGQLPRVARCS